MAGSCFAMEWASHLLQRQWPATFHPLHITYQAQALRDQLAYILGRRALPSAHWVEVEGRWSHLNIHSKWSHRNIEEAKARLRQAKDQSYSALQKMEYAVITLGTARSYTYRPTGKQIANCHKLHSSNFSVGLEDIDSIEEQLFEIQRMLTALPHFKHAIWTVSPVRHLRAGLIENQRSKARLITALATLTESEASAHYFPAYEWLIDVLRDYRFYKSDLAHPSEEAVSFIVDQFKQMYFASDALRLMNTLEKYWRLRQHRPSADTARIHEQKMEAMKARIQADFPGLSLNDSSNVRG
jgi:hypothetical protein